jgi:hypothetical protein
MAQMLELIRQSAVPANVMRSAARGALALPAAEMLEILVHLTTLPLWREQAELTLAGWDGNSACEVVKDPAAAPLILSYYLDPHNLRPALLPVLLENPSVPTAAIARIAESATSDVVQLLLASARVQHSRDVLQVLAVNTHVSEQDGKRISDLLTTSAKLATHDVEPSGELTQPSEFEIEHAAEIAAEEGTPFALCDAGPDELAAAGLEQAAVAAAAAISGAQAAATAQAPAKPEPAERISLLQRLSRMTVGERVQLAMRGTREERYVLIRDGSNIVATAVVESPKVGDTEMETLAAMKNIKEDALRAMSRNRRFMKQYGVIRALANNPRTPIDIGLKMLPYLMAADLHTLSRNKNISETVRKLALKMFQEKSEKNAGGRH